MLHNEIYSNMQACFVGVRADACLSGEYDNNNIRKLTELRAVLESHPDAKHEILIYCIDILFEIINEGDNTKIFEFADTVHNMPEICIENGRSFKTFCREIKAFRKKYGKHYFPFAGTKI